MKVRCYLFLFIVFAVMPELACAKPKSISCKELYFKTLMPIPKIVFAQSKPDSLQHFYACIKLYKKAQKALRLKKTVATKTDELIARARLLIAARQLLDDSNVMIEKKAACDSIIASMMIQKI